MSASRVLNTVSEEARERETLKYNPYVLTDCQVNHSGKPFPSSELSTATDSILTALAQLGTYQTQTERAFISLFDSKYQYMIAEASPLTPLTPRLPSSKCPEPLLHCGTAIPRHHGICEHLLFPESESGMQKHQTEEGMYFTTVSDLTADSRFSSKAHCPYSESCRFYAAVPIRTPKGIDIGAYCLINPTQPDTWDEQCLSRMKNISCAIMDHLDAKRSTHAYRRNERVTRGMGSFIEGKSTLSGWKSGPNVAAFADNARFEGALDAKQQRLEHQDYAPADDEPTTHGIGSEMRSRSPSGSWVVTLPGRRVGESTPLPSSREQPKDDQPIKSITHNQPRMGDFGYESTEVVFSRAANLIRESFEVAGCFFFDVTVGSYRAPAVPSPRRERQSADKGIASHQSSTGSSDENLPTSPSEESDSVCDLLSFSTSDGSSINDAKVTEKDGHITRRFLARLLRHYPDGKIFNFNTTGEFQSSDSSSDDTAIEVSIDYLDVASKGAKPDGSTAASVRAKQQRRGFDALKEGAVIHKAFPSARSVAFVPVWDPKRERWFAGGFVYTSTPTRVFTVRGELSFFTAFSKLIAAEVQTLETQQANKAKSDILGALSHELRSPLHGIVLGAELLNDTHLSVFQANSTHTIETCCRTLLDTVDHLLEYSKVNTYGTRRKQEAKATSPQMRKKGGTLQFNNKMTNTNVRIDSLVEEVADSIFAGFNFQHMSVGQLAKQTTSQSTDTAGHNRLDSKQAAEQLNLSTRGETDRGANFGDVSVDLSVDSSCEWMFYTQAGAIRRLVMNLLGNSLKYTAKGSIKISLTQDSGMPRHLKTGRNVKLVVQDTGQGIGEDYLRHKLFRPFCQEDELSSGTGLGLSLVKSIVSQLRGKIHVESKLDVGTIVTVTLPLELSSKADAKSASIPEDVKDFDEQLKNISGLRIRLIGFEPIGTVAPTWNRRAIFEDICRHWLHMELVPDDQAQKMAPDIVLWSNDALPESFGQDPSLARSPNVVVCPNALESYQRHNTCEAMGQEGTFEFITQPIGPRKLAKSIQLAYQRWIGLPRFQPPSYPSLVNQPQKQIKSSGADQERSPSEKAQPSSKTKKLPPTRSAQEGGVDQQASQFVSRSTQTTSTSTDESPSGAVKLLLVDDNNINLRMLCTYMGKLGREYETATNGKEALDKYVGNPCDYAGILMDVSMPIMDGLEATRRIRAHARQHHIRDVAIIALTGLSSDSAQQEAIESGVDVFLTKPVKFKSLSEVLESMKILSKESDGE